MKTKTVLVALALTLAPALAFAQGCNYGKSQQAMSCAEGTVYDTATGTCVAAST